MTLREVYERIDALYPKKISDDYVKTYGGHDNSGILLDPGREILGALFSLDLSLAAIEEAKKTGKNLIVTHHPAIFFPVSNILRSDPLGARLIACLEAGIGVISMHLNCDCARGGIDESTAGRGRLRQNFSRQRADALRLCGGREEGAFHRPRLRVRRGGTENQTGGILLRLGRRRRRDRARKGAGRGRHRFGGYQAQLHLRRAGSGDVRSAAHPLRERKLRIQENISEPERQAGRSVRIPRGRRPAVKGKEVKI